MGGRGKAFPVSSRGECYVDTYLPMNRNLGGRNYVFATKELSVPLTPLPLLGVFRDLDYLAQALPGRKILLPSLKGGLLVWCSKSSLGLNSGPRWFG